jgi:hypothetical protein
MSNERKDIPPVITMSSRVYKDLLISFKNNLNQLQML